MSSQTTKKDNVLNARAVTKSISGPGGRLDILKGVDLEVTAGEAVSIIGASGSGKSTLLGILAGLDVPTGGQISLLGQEISHLSEDQRASLRAGQVGFVFQSFQLLPSLTALENVMLSLELASAAKQARQIARETLTEVGLGERLLHYPAQLSGGEQQRVAIARAFATRPKILFADEPTGNLDQATGESIVRLLFNLKSSHNTALILVTHDASLAARCDQSYRLNQGILEYA
ncbi:ABC transporter ATP-binding protein [Ectothiorhodosinus mongolicus]|uniref:ABC transporter ATP-binding protein n=1 Tax=Ectothiorhodosinus mongolicus TaxID=233100 RepID=UPI00117889B3|nr:ABC transporter ATP-binding protein [Ectothiorhodosinus mongolicus]ULX56311.1 ABC transporter [Ectothiorhodosinus mongolicus]